MKATPYITSIAATGIKLAAALTVNKILATQLGPSTFGLWGNIFTVATFYMAFGNGGINSGLTAKFSGERGRQMGRPWLVAGLILSVLFSLCLMLVHKFVLQGRVIGLSSLPSHTVFLICLSAAIGGVLQSLALGRGQTSRNAIVLVVASLVSVSAYAILVRPNDLNSAVSVLSITALAPLLLWLASGQLSRKLVKVELGTIANLWPAVQGLLPYVFISLAPAVLGTASILLIRTAISEQLGLPALGHWQSVFRISDAIVAMTQAAVGFVVMPAVFRASDPAAEFRIVYVRYVWVTLAFGVVYVAAALALGTTIIAVLYSPEYAPAARFLWIQAAGDLVKALSAPIILYSIYRANVRFSWAAEFVFSFSFVALSWVLLSAYGNLGSYLAYFLASGVLLSICIFGVFKK